MSVKSEQRQPQPAAVELRLSVPPDPHEAVVVRRELLAFAARHGIHKGDLCDFISAVGEALANSMEHARTDKPIEVVLWMLGNDRLFASVQDNGIGFAPKERTAQSTLPDAFAERGRGLPIMQRCADIFSVRSAPGQGTRITLGCYVQRAEHEQLARA